MRKKAVLGLVIIALLIGWVGVASYRYANQVMVINIEGPIYEFQDTVSALYEASTNPFVKAVILYLNTPGGLAYPCIEIANYVKEAELTKPVIAVMGAECASGGYYIASFATKIITYENTITGGVGVLSVWVDLTEYYESQGIKVWVWSTGKEKDLGAPWRSPTEEEKSRIEEEVNRIHEKIMADIQKNRGLDAQTMEVIGEGDVFLGSDAVELDLADKVGNINTAINETVQTSNLTWYVIVSPDMDWRLRLLRAMWLF